MTRLETKIDSISETTVAIRETLAYLAHLPAKVKEHDDLITELRIDSQVSKTFATRKQLWVTNLIAVIAVLVAAAQWIVTVRAASSTLPTPPPSELPRK